MNTGHKLKNTKEMFDHDTGSSGGLDDANG